MERTWRTTERVKQLLRSHGQGSRTGDWTGVSSGLCASHSGSSTPNWEPFLCDAGFMHRGSVMLYRTGPNIKCSFKIADTLIKMITCCRMKINFNWSKGASLKPAYAQRCHLLICIATFKRYISFLKLCSILKYSGN